LKFFVYKDNPRCFVDILRQIPMLQVLHFSLRRDLLDDLTMPALWDIFIKVDTLNGTAVDNVLRSFTCPVLTKFTLKTSVRWTSETYGIIKQQYNFKRLQEANFLSFFMGPTLPVFSIFKDTPMLHSLSLERDGIMDNIAIMGLSDGSLGRFLRMLRLYYVAFNVGEVLDMVEARKKIVDELLEHGCTWKEESAILKGVEVNMNDKKKYQKRVSALKDAGITITFL
jgi:hypothetical protein